MPTLDRRRFLAASAATVAASRLHGFAQSPATHEATLKILQGDGPTVPANFVGLSYETQELANPTFFAAANTGLIARFRELAPHGVLRIGGNTSDVGWWKPTPDTPKPEIKLFTIAVGEPTGAQSFAIEPLAVRNLRGFLDATGWTCLYGINLGSNTPERAADEAAFVFKTLGPRLEYFQLGNEPDLFSSHLRDPKTWNADAFFDDWLRTANAIRARVPHAKFGLPDTSGNPEWYDIVVKRLLTMKESCGEFCDRQGACGCAEAMNDVSTRPRVAALSHHYYFGGPPANPDVNIEKLLQHSEKVDKLAHDISAAAAQLNSPTQKPVPYRMTEGNTCYRGGKPGLSDVFAATLWAADYLLTLASLGYAGVNLHGGGGDRVAASLGGMLPGEALMPDPKAPHPRPFYTPISNIDGKYVAEPVFYGMQFAQQFAGAQIEKIDFDAGKVNATAYAAKLLSGRTLIAIINKDETQPITIKLPDALSACTATLTAPSLDSRNVTWTGGHDFAGSASAASCTLHPKGSIEVPASSGLMVRLG
jgi:hypothetical protein